MRSDIYLAAQPCKRCNNYWRFMHPDERCCYCVERNGRDNFKIAQQMRIAKRMQNRSYVSVRSPEHDFVECWKDRKKRRVAVPAMVAGLTLQRLMAGR